MAKKRYTKIEEEVIQILNEADKEPFWHKLRRIRRPNRPRRPGGPGRRPAHFDSDWVPFAAAFVIALAAILIGGNSRTIATLLAIISIIVFFSPIFRSRGRASLPSAGSQSWRGGNSGFNFPPARDGFLGEVRYRIWEFRNRR